MAVRLNPKFKYYIYVFFDGDVCIYVGKGCGNRFKYQQKRFDSFNGRIFAYFMNEEDALFYERFYINEYNPTHNIAMNKESHHPWTSQLSPECKDTYYWIEILGKKEVCARILLAKPWSILKKYNIDIKKLLSIVENYNGEFYGRWC